MNPHDSYAAASRSHIVHLLLKGLSIGTVSALTHPITYPISASTLLCQANVVRTNDVHKIVLYAFSKAKSIKLFRGGGLASIIKTFINLASVAVEDIWLAVSPFRMNRDAANLVSKVAGLLFNISVNGPLDVIRTRLALEEFGSRPDPTPHGLTDEYRKIVRQEGYSALYSGWQIVVLQYILDYWFQVWDRETSRKQEGSVVQLVPMLVKFFTDYAFTVIKIRANIHNDGLFNILRSIFSQKGLRGFMAGWRLHFLLFPTVMVNMILANILFLQLKKLFLSRKPPPGISPPPVNVGENQEVGPGNNGEIVPGTDNGNNNRGEASGSVRVEQKSTWVRVNSSFF